MMGACDMKPLHPIEQIALTLLLAVVCAMATTRCTHAQPIKNDESIGFINCTASRALAIKWCKHEPVVIFERAEVDALIVGVSQ